VTRRVSAAFGGGVALGAFHAGVVAGMQAAGLRPDWLLGSSVGAVAAALVAGGPPEEAAMRLDRFWRSVAFEPWPAASFWPGALPGTGPLRRAEGDAAIARTLLLGRQGVFRPDLRPTALSPALYDLVPLRRTLSDLVDFERLNGPGAPRVTVVASDLVTGEAVSFDTARGERIGLEELIASCSLPPLYPPVELRGRLLGDGGLTANLPLAAALSEPGAEEVLCIAADLFPRQGTRPASLTEAAARAGDVVFGSRTADTLAAERRAHALRMALRAADPAAPLAEGPRRVTVLLLGMRPAPDDAGVLKPFDFSRAALAARRAAGLSALETALEVKAEGGRRAPPGGAEGFVVHEVTAPRDLQAPAPLASAG